MTETTPAATSAYLSNLKGQLLRAAIYLAVLYACHYFWLGLKPLILWTLVGVIVACAFVPARFSGLASAVGFFVVAGVAYFGYHQTPVAVVCAIFGVLNLTEARGLFRSG